MLTPKQNLLETIRGGNPERFVRQYEAFKFFYPPFSRRNPRPQYGGEPVVNAWGVTIAWPLGTPGAFPVHTDDKIVIKDITRWREFVHAPEVRSTDEEWAPILDAVAAVDRDEYYVTFGIAPGVFEQCHYLGGIQNILMDLYLEPDAMHELIDYITDWELGLAEEICSHAHPDAILHHDDWGSQISTFMSPDMFSEFILPAAKKIYGYYHDNGVELIVHHSDSYAATLVPDMIEAGIDIWQGAMSTNDLPSLIREYGGKISFMGGVDCSKVDFEGSTRENIRQVVSEICKDCGKLYFIPCTTQGGPASIYPGVYDTVNEEIDFATKSLF